MNEKPWYQSMTILGLIAIVVTTILSKLHKVDDPQAAQAEVLNGLVVVGQLIGAVMVLVGRLRAKHTITLTALALACVMAAGCGSHDQIDKANTMAQISIVAYQKNVNDLVEAFLGSYRVEHQAMADQLAGDALRSVVKPDGSADAATVQAIQGKRLEQYQQIESVIVSMRSKLIAANADGANAVALMDGARQYWQQQASTADLANRASDGAIQLLQQYLAKRSAPK